MYLRSGGLSRIIYVDDVLIIYPIIIQIVQISDCRVPVSIEELVDSVCCVCRNDKRSSGLLDSDRCWLASSNQQHIIKNLDIFSHLNRQARRLHRLV